MMSLSPVGAGLRLAWCLDCAAGVDEVWACANGSRFQTRWRSLAQAESALPKVSMVRLHRNVMVRPEAIDDLEAGIIAREIAKQIEDELTYPGQIRVTVIRESRASEIAH